MLACLLEFSTGTWIMRQQNLTSGHENTNEDFKVTQQAETKKPAVDELKNNKNKSNAVMLI